MRSNGGVASGEQVARKPVETLLSGPAGGVLGAAVLSDITGIPNLITADVGGTSFDVSVIQQGIPAFRTEGTIEGYPVRLPHIAIHTIGAGGGSIAWIDRAGGLQVGPRSAGSLPGPICYGRGGKLPTVTDAQVVLGRIESLLGGEMRADVASARDGLEEQVGLRLGISAEAAAEGVLRIVNAAMVRAIRTVTVEQGIDPRQFTLAAYGGAGPLHSLDVARDLGIGEVLIPVAPGNFSALGLLSSPLRQDRVRTFLSLADSANLEYVQEVLREMEEESARDLQEAEEAPRPVVFERSVDVRYKGQSYELTVPLGAGPVDSDSWRRAMETFQETHERTYGFRHAADPLEVVSLRVAAVAPSQVSRWKTPPPSVGEDAVLRERPVYMGGSWRGCSVIQRSGLAAGDEIPGPCVIEEAGSTTVLGPSDRAVVDEWLNLRIAVGGQH
jgi:N-methylhydantoinase A